MMNKKILALLSATALLIPSIHAYAEITVSGTIQAETASLKQGKADRQRITKDIDGAVLPNEGANGLTFDINEKLANGLTAYARYGAAFSTSGNTGLNAGGEAWVGLKGDVAHFKFGKFEGIYKVVSSDIDPFTFTSLGASGTAGGMSGQAFNQQRIIKVDGSGNDVSEDGVCYGKSGRIAGFDYQLVPNETEACGTDHRGLSNNDFISNALEFGAEFGKFSLTFQGNFDETDVMEGSGLLGLRYVDDNFTVFAAGSYVDFDATKLGTDAKNSKRNWKVGGSYKLSNLTLGIQYESAELGVFDNSDKGGKYGLVSADYRVGNVGIGGWLGGYFADAENEDAKAGALGIKYYFSNRTMVYSGYRLTNAKNDYRDEKVFALGVRHSF
jgi:predicted porin